MKRFLALSVAIMLLMTCLSMIALAETKDLSWYEEMLTGTWEKWEKSPTKFTYPGASFWGYNEGTTLIATEGAVYLVMWGNTYGTDAAWYEIGLSEDGTYLLLLPANGYNANAGLYIKQQ